MEYFDPIERDGDFLLLEERTINDRALVCWFNPDDSFIKIALFHTKNKPTGFLGNLEKLKWGWLTYYTNNILKSEEARQVVDLYIKDMEDGNFWWEPIPF